MGPRRFKTGARLSTQNSSPDQCPSEWFFTRTGAWLNLFRWKKVIPTAAPFDGASEL
jgi:hypothetical protein